MAAANFKVLEAIAVKVLDSAARQGLMIAGAESCTGGLVSAVLTAIPGSSSAFAGCAVCYSNKAKQQILGVPARLLADYGAVSMQTALAMAHGAVSSFGVDIAYAVTGVAGPGGGSPEKPVGTVWFSLSMKGRDWTDMQSFDGSRDAIRHEATRYILLRLLSVLEPDVSPLADAGTGLVS